MYHVRRGAMLDKLYNQDWPERVHVPPKETRKRSLHYSCLRLRNEKQVEGTRRLGHNLLGRKRVHVLVILQHRQHRAAVQTTIGGGHASWERSCQHWLQTTSLLLWHSSHGPVCLSAAQTSHTAEGVFPALAYLQTCFWTWVRVGNTVFSYTSLVWGSLGFITNPHWRQLNIWGWGYIHQLVWVFFLLLLFDTGSLYVALAVLQCTA